MQLCEYGCGQEARFQFKNGKWCCSESHQQCPILREKNSKVMKGQIPWNKRKILSSKHKRKISESKKGQIQSEETKRKRSNSMKGKNTGPLSKEHKKKMSNSMKGKNTGPQSEEHKRKRSEGHKLTIKQINERYPFFSKIEEMRYNPKKPLSKKEIQVHCKNHNCKNSKEKEGWFTPSKGQLFHRIDAIEKPTGFGESNFYCSQYCKDTCILFGLKGDPYKNTNLPYTPGEIQVYNKNVLDRENGLCEYCGEPAEHVHHIYPKKLEPFFALDPDYGVACCEKHHYKYAHKDECSTGNLANIVCSVESQKFLNQS